MTENAPEKAAIDPDMFWDVLRERDDYRSRAHAAAHRIEKESGQVRNAQRGHHRHRSARRGLAVDPGDARTRPPAQAEHYARYDGARPVTRLAHLTWPPTADNAADWEAACDTGGGDTGGDGERELEPMSDRDGDWLAAREENFAERQKDWWLA